MKRTTLQFLLTALAVLPCIVLSQSVTISGRVMMANGKPPADAILQLLRARDSAMVKTDLSTDEGNFVFPGVDTGAYFIQHLPVGSRVTIVPPFVATSDVTLAPATIPEAGKQLSEVSVVAVKPFVERQKGKVVINPESIISTAGASALEVLEKAPGVRVDYTDNITLNGRPGTMVWVDGKPSPLTGADLGNFLRGIPSTAIEKIELIANPSARYDAAGSSIINIVMKKDKRIGTNGNLSLSYGQGVYPKANGTVGLNHRDRKVNIFSSYSFARRLNFNDLALRREFAERDSFIGAFDQHNYFKYDFNSHSVRLGADYFINKKNTLGILVNGVANGFDRTGQNLSEVFNSDNVRSSTFLTGSSSRNRWQNYSANINYKHIFDSTGTELSTDLDYSGYGNISRQDFDTRYYDLLGLELTRPYILHGDMDGALQIWSLKNDYTRELKKGWKLEAGQKSSYVVADNDLQFFDRSAGESIFDTTKSNHFIYTENINAAYVSASAEKGKWSLQTGLRAEHTFVRGEQKVHDRNFLRNYVQLFPSAIITYKISRLHGLELNYSRRIRRPGYDQLNPFKYYLDPTTYREGNPYLKPSITESLEFTYIFREKITSSLGFGRTFDNLIEVIAPVAGVQRVTAQTNVNLSMVDVYTWNSSLPIDINKWWNTSTSFNLYYASYSGDVANTRISGRGNAVFSLNFTNTFTLTKSLSAEISGSYQSREVYAFDVIEPIWSVNAGLQQKLFRNNGTLRLNVTDIFYTNVIPARVAFTDYRERFLVKRDTRVATVSFTYRFGKSSVPGARRRQGGAEDLKQRAGSGVG